MIIIKFVVLSIASGTFLFMSTVHELENAPMIKDCSGKKNYILLFIGFVVTAFVRFLIGEAHKL